MSTERAERELLRPIEAHELHGKSSFLKYFWIRFFNTDTAGAYLPRKKFSDSEA